MSDLEQAASRAPIIRTAVGKLRSLSGHATRFGETDGLVDAFADVFAQMAIAAPPPAERPPSTADVGDEPDQPATTPAEASDGDSSDGDQPAEAQLTENLVDDQPLLNEPALEPAADHQQDLGAEVDTDTGTTLDSQNEIEDSNVESALVAQQQTIEGDRDEQESDSETALESAPIAAADSQTQRRDRRETAVNRSRDSVEPRTETIEPKPTKATPAGDAEQQPATGQSDPRQGESGESGEPAERTTRQEFLDQRRTQQSDSKQGGKPLTADRGSHPVESSAPSPTGTATTPEAAAVRSSPATQATIAAAQSSLPSSTGEGKSSAVRTSAGTISQRGEGKPTGSIQAETGTRPNRATGGETRSTKNESAHSSTAARVKLVQRVSRAFQHLGPEGGIIRLRLAPAELGSVKVEMQIHQRKVQARVVAETEAASTALREHLPDLRSRLESYGMQVERLEIETDSNDGQTGSPFDRQGQDEHDPPTSRRPPPPEQQPSQESPSERNRTERDDSDRIATVSAGVDLRL